MSVKAYRTAEVAERLNVSSHTVRRWIEDGRLAAEHTAGGQARITEGALQEFLRRKQDQPRCQVVAFANQKGGVGKTTSAVAVSAALVDSGQRVCLIDVDPQANATDAVGFDRHRPYPALHDALRAALDGQEAALPLVPLEPGWDLVPSHIDLARMETEIILKAMNKVKILRPLIDPLRAYYDWIILDCGPSLGLINLNALLAADWVLIPQVPDSISAQGLGQLEQTIRDVQRWGREDRQPQPLAVLGVFLVRVEHADHHRQMREQLAAFCQAGHLPFLSARTEEERRENRPDQVEIPKTVAVADAFGETRPVSRYTPAGAARDGYRKLAQLMMAQVGHPVEEPAHA